jgi:hypothetical protein
VALGNFRVALDRLDDFSGLDGLGDLMAAALCRVILICRASPPCAFKGTVFLPSDFSIG